LWRLKGVDVLLRAFATLDSRARLTIVGAGPQEGELHALAAALGVADRVTFAGAVPRTSLADFYSRADVVCIPSLSEALPTVALEAMLCGVPVVGSDTGGLAWVVQDGITGHLAAPADVAALAAALALAASSPEHLAGLGKHGQARALAEFQWSV